MPACRSLGAGRGEGEGGGGQDEDLLGPPSPLSLRLLRRSSLRLRRPGTEGGVIFGRICLINYGLINNRGRQCLFAMNGSMTHPFR
jgi:hypothetical protein